MTDTRPTRIRFAVLAALCSLAFLTYLDRFCITQVQDDVARDLRFGELTPAEASGLNPDELALEVRARTLQRQGWMFSAFLLGYLLLEVPAGWLGDRCGARAVLAGLVVFWSFFTLMSGYSDLALGLAVEHPEPLLLVGGIVLMRFLVGAGEAGAFPNISRAVGGWFPLTERGAATGAVWTCSRLGAFLTFAITAWLVQTGGGWRPAFLGLGAIGCAWALAFAVWFRNWPEQMRGVNAAECALIRTGAPPPAAHSGPGTPWRRVFFSANLWGFYLTAFAISYAWYFYGTFLPKFLKERYPDEMSGQDWLKGLPFLVGAAGCLAGGRLSDFLVRRWGRRWGRSGVGLFAYLTAGACALIASTMTSASGVVALVCVACFVQDLAVPVLWTVPIDVAGRHAGTVSGLMNCVGGVGGALSPVAVATIAAHPQLGWDYVFYAAGAAYFLGGLLWLKVDASRSIE
jgi:MFS transporter, ACS family, glucarate transporter